MSKFDKSKFTPPFRVGRKQGKAVLDSKGLDVVFFKNSELQAQLYCNYLNEGLDEDETITIYLTEDQKKEYDDIMSGRKFVDIPKLMFEDHKRFLRNTSSRNE